MVTFTIVTNNPVNASNGIKSRIDLVSTIENTFARGGEVALLRQRPGKKDNGIRLITALPGEVARSVAVQLSDMYRLKKVVNEHKLDPIFRLLDTLATKIPKLKQYKSRIFLFDRDRNTTFSFFQDYNPQDVIPKKVPSSVTIYNKQWNDGLDIVYNSDLLDLETYLTAVANPDAEIVRQRYFAGSDESMTLTQIQSL